MIWKNIKPKAPWTGGVHERMIGLTKEALKRAIGILNTRPSTYLNFDDYKIIRPIDFITPYVSLDIPTNEDSIQDEFTLHPLSQPLDVFWEIWKNEYLSSLRERTQREIASPKRVEKRTSRRGEIVLLNESGLPRGIWELVKVQELNIGKDG
uniref:DUF5641 domain-containing protein n=1 Tax=Loa loa TaxID=7209 RepID=A0A1I7VVH6_LOALO